MAFSTRFGIGAFALALALSGCGAPALTSLNQADAGFAALASGGAKTIKTPIGSITLGLLPDRKSGSKKEEINRLPTFEDEIGLPGFEILRSKNKVAKSADLRGYFRPVRNQGSLGSCSAFATVGVMEAMLKIKGKKAPELSPMFFYYAERKLMEDENLLPKATKRDTGAFMFVASETAVKFGTTLEKDSPYRTGKPALAYDASEAEFAAAKEFKFAKRKRVSTVNGIKSALSQKKPVLMAITLYDSFMTKEVANSGLVPVPEKGEGVAGGHAVVAVGFDDEKQAFLVRNSWGSDWGQKGYFWMPYDYYKVEINNHFYYGDCWVLD